MRVIAGAVMLVAAGLFALASASVREGVASGLVPNKNQGKKDTNQE